MNECDYEDYIIVFNEYSHEREYLEHFMRTTYPTIKIDDKLDLFDSENYYRTLLPVNEIKSNILWIDKLHGIGMFRNCTPVQIAEWAGFNTAKIVAFDLIKNYPERYLAGLSIYLQKHY